MYAHCHTTIDAAYAMPLVINALDGHKIVDAEGKAPYLTNLSPWLVTADTTDDYQTYWLDNFPLPIEEMQNMLYRYNPDVTYETIADSQEAWGYDWIVNYGK